MNIKVKWSDDTCTGYWVDTIYDTSKAKTKAIVINSESGLARELYLHEITIIDPLYIEQGVVSSKPQVKNNFGNGNAMPIDKSVIQQIRILPSDAITYPTEPEFKNFVEKIIPSRGGLYYNKRCITMPANTLIFLQYKGAIRGVGVLIDEGKRDITDEEGRKYTGFYKLDINTIKFLDNPISKEQMMDINPKFKKFSQAPQIIPLDCIDELFKLI